MNTILGGSGGVLSSMVLNFVMQWKNKESTTWSLLVAINGGIAGMISSCAAGFDMNAGAGFFMGKFFSSYKLHAIIQYRHLCGPDVLVVKSGCCPF